AENRAGDRVDDPSVTGLGHVRPDGAAQPDVPHQVNVDDLPDVVVADLIERREELNTRIVDQNVDPAPRVERGLDDCLGAVSLSDAVAVGDSLAALGTDLLRDRLGIRPNDPATVRPDTEVVDDNLRTPLGEQVSVR